MALRKVSETRPQIQDVTPPAAIPGGEFRIRGKALTGGERTRARFGEVPAPVVIGSDSLVIVRVPDAARLGELTLGTGTNQGSSWICGIGIQTADSLPPVSNPAIDKFGNIYAIFSGSAGQRTAVSVY